MTSAIADSSDLLTPLAGGEKHVIAAGEADFICFTTRAAAGAKGIWRARLTCAAVKRKRRWRGEIRRT